MAPRISDFDHLLRLLNHILHTAPAWNDAGYSVGLIGCPMNAVFDWPMATPAGFGTFLDPEVNAMVCCFGVSQWLLGNARLRCSSRNC